MARAVDDSVFATPLGWVGLDRRLGWRVTDVESERVLVLESWGAFVIQPDGPGRSRLIVRTRGGGPERIADLLLAPVGFLAFEPAHFIMERRMLLEIKRRAERPQNVGSVICERTTPNGAPPGPDCPTL